MSAITVQRAVHFESASLAEAAQVTDIAYASKDKPVLLESVTLGKRGVIRRSEDNGQTWKTVEELPFGLKLETPAPYRTLVTQELARRGVHMPAYVYIMGAHTSDDIDAVLAALKEVMPLLRTAIDRGSVEGMLEVPVVRPLFKRRQV